MGPKLKTAKPDIPNPKTVLISTFWQPDSAFMGRQFSSNLTEIKIVVPSAVHGIFDVLWGLACTEVFVLAC